MHHLRYRRDQLRFGDDLNWSDSSAYRFKRSHRRCKSATFDFSLQAPDELGCFIFFKKNSPSPASFWLFSFISNNLQTKTLDLSRIRTRIDGVEGEHADHLTQTTTSAPNHHPGPKPPPRPLGCYIYPRSNQLLGKGSFRL